MHIFPVRAAFVPPYNWPPCPLPPSASPLLALRSVGWMLSAVCAMLHPQWGTSRFLFSFPEYDSVEINREDLLSDPFVHLFSSFFASRCRSFAFPLRRERLRDAGYWNLLPGLCKQVFPSPPAVHRGLLPRRQRSPTHSAFFPCVWPCSSTVWVTHDRMHGPSGMKGVSCDAGRMRVFGGTPSLLWRWTGRFYRSTLSSFRDDAADDNWNPSCLIYKRTATVLFNIWYSIFFLLLNKSSLPQTVIKTLRRLDSGFKKYSILDFFLFFLFFFKKACVGLYLVYNQTGVFFSGVPQNWLWLQRLPAPSSGRKGRRGSGRRQMPAAAWAAPVKPKETVRNPVGLTSSPESNSLAPRRGEGDDQVCCALVTSRLSSQSLYLYFSSSNAIRNIMCCSETNLGRRVREVVKLPGNMALQTALWGSGLELKVEFHQFT